MQFSPASDLNVVLAETPIWDPRIGKLYWTDLFKGTVYRFDPISKTNESIETNQIIGSAIPTNDPNKLLVAIDDGIALVNWSTGEKEIIASPVPNTGEFRYNDTRCDARGRVFTSTVSKNFTEPSFNPETMAGKFFMIDTNGSVSIIVDKIVQYNTIFFNNNNTCLYAIDTWNKQLHRFDYSLNDGIIGDLEVVIQFEDTPDGAVVDVEDNVYICHWSDKKHISVWNLKDYKFKEFINFPVKHICCAGFAGKDMKDFYVATSKFWIEENDADLKAGAGGLFVAKSKIAGTPERIYPFA